MAYKDPSPPPKHTQRVTKWQGVHREENSNTSAIYGKMVNFTHKKIQIKIPIRHQFLPILWTKIKILHNTPLAEVYENMHYTLGRGV